MFREHQRWGFDKNCAETWKKHQRQGSDKPAECPGTIVVSHAPVTGPGRRMPAPRAIPSSPSSIHLISRPTASKHRISQRLEAKIEWRSKIHGKSMENLSRSLCSGMVYLDKPTDVAGYQMTCCKWGENYLEPRVENAKWNMQEQFGNGMNEMSWQGQTFVMTIATCN